MPHTTTDRILNFSAGPATLPEPVLMKAREAIWNIDDSGIGICEHSHRGKVFDRVITEAVADCREVGGIPDDFEILFLQGGATMQFAMVPMNFLPDGGVAGQRHARADAPTAADREDPRTDTRPEHVR